MTRITRMSKELVAIGTGKCARIERIFPRLAGRGERKPSKRMKIILAAQFVRIAIANRFRHRHQPASKERLGALGEVERLQRPKDSSASAAQSKSTGLVAPRFSAQRLGSIGVG